MAEIQDTIREIKSKFRLFMNGMVSQSMREKGIDYKLNFGIEYGKKTSANVRLWPDCSSP